VTEGHPTSRGTTDRDTTIRKLTVSTYRVPTPAPEADGTATWDATQLVVVQPVAGSQVGLGWSYCAAPAAAQGSATPAANHNPSSPARTCSAKTSPPPPPKPSPDHTEPSGH